MSELPPGFVLDQPSSSPLPPGFVLDQPSMLEDAAKSIGAGLGSATIGTLGMVGDVRSLLSHGVDAVGSKLGFDPSAIKTAAGYAFPGLNIMPTSQQIRATVSDPIVSPDYQPQTELGSVLKKGAEFAPNMLLGGPESVGARFLTNVAVPAIGSEIGEKVAGPYGGVAGALAGGIGATSAANRFRAAAAARQAEQRLPTGENLLRGASHQFDQARDMNVIVTPDWATNAANDIRASLRSFDPESHAAVFRAADRLENLGNAGHGMPLAPVPMNEVEYIRKQLVSLKTSPDASVREASRRAIRSLQDSQTALTQADVLQGNAGAYTRLSRDAIADWAAGKRSGAVTGKIDLGELNAATAGSGANQDNALRQAFKQLARPVNNTNIPKWQRLGFNDAEGAAIEQAATGTRVGNTARYLGKYAPTGVVSAAGSAGLGHLVGGPVGAAIPAVGYIAKKIGDLSTARAVAAVDSLVRSRSPLARAVAAQVNPQIIAQLPARTQRILQSMVPAGLELGQQGRQPVGQPNTY